MNPALTWKKIYIGNIHSLEDWHRACSTAALHGKVARFMRPGGFDFGFIVMRTHGEALAVIKAIGSSRFDTSFDCDYETMRVVRVPRLYATWARE